MAPTTEWGASTRAKLDRWGNPENPAKVSQNHLLTGIHFARSHQHRCRSAVSRGLYGVARRFGLTGCCFGVW